MNRILLSIFLFLIFLINPLFSEALQTIRWKGISSALGYVVEIKDESGNVTTKNTKKPNITLSLSRGKYSYRVAVLNKLNSIEKWSSWNQLEVKPVAPPIVDTSSPQVEVDSKSVKITFLGENIYEGTKAFVIQNGKRIPAKIETTRDGKTNILIADKRLVDPQKDHKVILENPKFAPIEVAISGKLVNQPQEKSPDLPIRSTSDFTPETNKKFWPMFWRQVALPGWGHQYVGHNNTAIAYYTLLGGSLINASVQNENYKARSASFRTAEDYAEGIRAGTDPMGLLIPLYMNGLESKVDEQRNRLNLSVGAVGAVYATAILHIIYTGTKNSMGTRKHSFLSMLWRQMILPGWGHYLIGDEATAYTYFGLLSVTSLNASVQNHIYRERLSDFRTMEDNAEAVRALNPEDPFVPLLINTKETRVFEQRNRLNNSVGAVGAVYLTSILHIMITAHLRKYNHSDGSQFGFGVRPDEPIGIMRSLDPNHLRADVRYSFYF